MIGELQCVVLDCPDAPGLARFYQALLGGVVNRADPRWAVGDDFTTLHTESGPVFAFQRVPGFTPPQWPDRAHPQQFHLDLAVPDLGQAHAQLLELGATLLHVDSRGWRVYADPAGHPFCILCEPARSYLGPVISVGDPVTGVDACAGGWVAVTLQPSPDPATTDIAIAPTLDGLSLSGVVAIDMPLGLLADGWRTADQLARRALGRRGVTVFAIPPRPVWHQPGYAEANAACRAQTGKGLAAQTWGLRAKLLEADAYRRRSPARLHEVHPELAFAAMAGAPLAASKHTEPGLVLRRNLLAQVGITLPARVAGAGVDDLLDAAAVAWSARRIAAGQAVTLTDPTQRADDGAEIAIRY